MRGRDSQDGLRVTLPTPEALREAVKRARVHVNAWKRPVNYGGYIGDSDGCAQAEANKRGDLERAAIFEPLLAAADLLLSEEWQRMVEALAALNVAQDKIDAGGGYRTSTAQFHLDRISAHDFVRAAALPLARKLAAQEETR